MEIKSYIQKLKELVIKYKYALIVLVIGLLLLLMPNKKQETIQHTTINKENLKVEANELSDILQTIEGAGRVQVLLSIASGEKTFYQTNQDTSVSTDQNNSKIETVLITDSQRNESGLIIQTNPPTYKGAIVVCEGADSPAVRLSITQAVSRITGLGTDNICVLKMK